MIASVVLALVLVYAPNLGPRWGLTEAVEAWSAGPVEVQVTDQPCLRECITIDLVPEPYPIPVYGDRWRGLAYIYPDHCEVVLSRTTPKWLRLGVTSHEIGHCLGLPHRKTRFSVMSNPGQYPLPTRTDIAALWRRYL